MPRLLVTGANGFVGRAVLARAARDGAWRVRAVVRDATRASEATAGDLAHEVSVVQDGLSPTARWDEALHDVDAVIHLAARVHVMQDASADPLAEFRRVNVAGMERLALAAVEAGVRRFVYVSSIKVNGERTEPGRPFRADDVPRPGDPYGVSKAEAEAKLREIAARTGLEVVVVRPPLVYGPGVRANFRALLQLVARGLPLPLGAVRNRRSLVAVENLADLLLTCVTHPRAPGQTFLASDDDDLSTPELVRRIARAVGRTPRLVAVPPVVLRATAAALGRGEQVRRLCDSLEVDVAPTRRTLDWSPPLEVDRAIAGTVAAWRATRANA